MTLHVLVHCRSHSHVYTVEWSFDAPLLQLILYKSIMEIVAPAVFLGMSVIRGSTVILRGRLLYMFS